MKRYIAYAFSLATLLLTFLSCTREEMKETGPGGTITLHFGTSTLQTTKVTTPGDGVVADGGGLYLDGSGNPDLVILIANSDGDIVITYPNSERSGIPYGTLDGAATATLVKLSFDFSTLSSGKYTVYAFGNTSGLWPMTDGTNNYASGSDLLSLTTEEQVNNLRFQDQERNTTGWEDDSFNDPGVKTWDDGVAVLNSRLPVSARTSLTVSPGKNGEAYLELVRCVAKITAIIKNNTTVALDLLHYRHTVHDINPSSGYVIPRESNDFCGTAGNLLQYPEKKYSPDPYPDPNDVPPIHISEVGSESYSWYVFPSKGPYTICIGFTENSIDHTYFKLPITNWSQVNIPELKRNQHMIVTTRLSEGKTVSFNFTVNEWDDDHVSSVIFD